MKHRHNVMALFLCALAGCATAQNSGFTISPGEIVGEEKPHGEIVGDEKAPVDSSFAPMVSQNGSFRNRDGAELTARELAQANDNAIFKVERGHHPEYGTVYRVKSSLPCQEIERVKVKGKLTECW